MKQELKNNIAKLFILYIQKKEKNEIDISKITNKNKKLAATIFNIYSLYGDKIKSIEIKKYIESNDEGGVYKYIAPKVIFIKDYKDIFGIDYDVSNFFHEAGINLKTGEMIIDFNEIKIIYEQALLNENISSTTINKKINKI